MINKNKFASKYTANQNAHSAFEIAKEFQNGKQSPSEYLKDLFSNIEKGNPELNRLCL